MGQEKDVPLAIFSVGDEEYAIHLDSLVEILFDFKIDYLPHLGHHYVGTTVFPKKKGQNIPIVDLASLLNLPTSKEKRYLLVAVDSGRRIGFLIDSPTEVVKITKNAIHSLPEVFTEDEKKYLEGIVKFDDRLIGLIQPVKAVEVLSPEPGQGAKTTR